MYNQSSNVGSTLNLSQGKRLGISVGPVLSAKNNNIQAPIKSNSRENNHVLKCT